MRVRSSAHSRWTSKTSHSYRVIKRRRNNLIQIIRNLKQKWAPPSVSKQSSSSLRIRSNLKFRPRINDKLWLDSLSSWTMAAKTYSSMVLINDRLQISRPTQDTTISLGCLWLKMLISSNDPRFRIWEIKSLRTSSSGLSCPALHRSI